MPSRARSLGKIARRAGRVGGRFLPGVGWVLTGLTLADLTKDAVAGVTGSRRRKAEREEQANRFLEMLHGVERGGEYMQEARLSETLGQLESIEEATGRVDPVSPDLIEELFRARSELAAMSATRRPSIDELAAVLGVG